MYLLTESALELLIDIVFLPVPSPRWGHSFCKIDQDNALIIGGQGVRSQISKDSIWQYEFCKFIFRLYFNSISFFSFYFTQSFPMRQSF